MKKPKGKDEKNSDLCQIENLNEMLCYKEMKKSNLFEGIDITKDTDIRAKIQAKKLEKEYPKKYFNSAYNLYKNINEEYFIKKSGDKVDRRAQIEDIPINENLRNNSSFLEVLYTLLYVYKNLKWYRNTVAHPNEETENKTKDLSVEELRAWIAFYIEIFMEVLDKANEIFMEQVKKNLEEKYPKKHSK